MSNNIHLGDGVSDVVKTEINNGIEEIAITSIRSIVEFLKSKIKNLPEAIEQCLNSSEMEREITALWSEYLAEKGYVSRRYGGLSDDLLIANLHQEGYMDGVYIGYILAMMALVDNDIPKDAILSIRNYIRPNLMGHHFDDRNEFVKQYKEEKYSWLEKTP